MVLALSIREADRLTRVLVLAVTHTPPFRVTDAVAIPSEVKRSLALDDAPSWIVTKEANAFLWPGPDVRPIPGRTPATVVYGRVPDSPLRDVAQSYLANRDSQKARLVSRTE